ncbi:MAG: hypothetical protein GY861_22670 [bacterium]|nr:hypothetical protein [bacterium]
MATLVKNIAIPLSNFYVDVPVPATGTKLTITAGVPAGGTHIGSTIGEGTWEYARDTIELDLEQYTSIPDGGLIYNNESLTVTIPIAELTKDKLAKAITGEIVAVDGGHLVTIGGKTEPETFSVVLVAEHRAGSGIYHYFMVYKSISQEGVSLSFSKADGQTYEMSCRGMADMARPAGDQLGHAFIATIP